MNGLKGRVAMITGVSRTNGIGYAIAERFATQGVNLYLHSYTQADIDMGLIDKPGEIEKIIVKINICIIC